MNLHFKVEIVALKMVYFKQKQQHLTEKQALRA